MARSVPAHALVVRFTAEFGEDGALSSHAEYLVGCDPLWFSEDRLQALVFSGARAGDVSAGLNNSHGVHEPVRRVFFMSAGVAPAPAEECHDWREDAPNCGIV